MSIKNLRMTGSSAGVHEVEDVAPGRPVSLHLNYFHVKSFELNVFLMLHDRACQGHSAEARRYGVGDPPSMLLRVRGATHPYGVGDLPEFQVKKCCGVEGLHFCWQMRQESHRLAGIGGCGGACDCAKLASDEIL